MKSHKIYKIIKISLITITLLILKISYGTDELISLKLKNVPTKSALYWLSEVLDKNLVISDQIEDNLTLNVHEVSWADLFRTILQSLDLAANKIGDITYVAPIKNLDEYLLDLEKIKKKEALKVMFFKLNNVDASNLLKRLKDDLGKGLLSNRAILTADVLTNSIIIQDVETNFAHIKDYLTRIDHLPKQILIAAKIVGLDSSYERDLGLRFGVTEYSPQSAQQFSLDLPTVVGERERIFNIALLKINDRAILNARLEALETQGRAEIISSPKIMTANQKEAIIETGESIPYQESVGDGVTAITFKKAVLSLKVTPFVISTDQIMLELELSHDKLGGKVVNNQPTIDTHTLTSNVIVKNGQTVVLGGIYKIEKRDNIEQIPLLGSIPFIGRIFQYKNTTEDKKELLVFVTPKIIE